MNVGRHLVVFFNLLNTKANAKYLLMNIARRFIKKQKKQTSPIARRLISVYKLKYKSVQDLQKNRFFLKKRTLTSVNVVFFIYK